MKKSSADKRLIYRFQNNYIYTNIKEINACRVANGLEPLKPKVELCLRCKKDFRTYQHNVKLCDKCRHYAALDSNFFTEENES